MNPLVEYLEGIAALPEPFCPIEKFVIAHGTDHIPQRKPKSFRRGRRHNCFQNSTHLVLKHEELRYVEGFGLRTGMPIALLHAWCIDPEGRVIDITWTDPETCYYRGIVIEREMLYSELVRLGHYGLLDGMAPNLVLMQRLGCAPKSIGKFLNYLVDTPAASCILQSSNEPTESAMTDHLTTDHMQIANTILEQLGGRRFVAMTGAKNLIGGHDGLGSLTMKLPPCGFKKTVRGKAITHVRITLTPSDVYTVETLNVKQTGNTTLETANDVYCDTLQDQFLSMTGLMTRFGQ